MQQKMLTDAEALIQKQLALLEDTVRYYSEDITRRAQHPSTGECEYETLNGKCCAVGRLLPEKWTIGDDTKTRKFLNGAVSSVFDLLPDNVREYGCTFLTELQRLHDKAIYWTPGKLTIMGNIRVNEIRQHILNGNYIES